MVDHGDVEGAEQRRPVYCLGVLSYFYYVECPPCTKVGANIRLKSRRIFDICTDFSVKVSAGTTNVHTYIRLAKLFVQQEV